MPPLSSSINPFESGERKVIPAVLVYLRSGDKTLMIHRCVQGRLDFHHGKWNGLGGKCEVDESPVEAALREVREESGLDLAPSQLFPLGVLQFPNFKAHRNEDWIVFVFSAEVRADQLNSILAESHEGSLHWVSNQDLLSLNLWAGDRHFIPWVLENKSFLGTFWYRDQKLDRYWITPFTGREPSEQF